MALTMVTVMTAVAWIPVATTIRGRRVCRKFFVEGVVQCMFSSFFQDFSCWTIFVCDRCGAMSLVFVFILQKINVDGCQQEEHLPEDHYSKAGSQISRRPLAILYQIACQAILD